MDDFTDKLDIPIIDTVGLEILMHRDVHFGGNFEIMIEYYEKDGVGVMPDFSIEQIKGLQALEKKEGKDLAASYLPTPAKEQVAKSKELYIELRNAYESKKAGDPMLLVSDLLLAEEESPDAAMDALVQQGPAVLPALIHLISSSSFYDPLYPGYGRAPIFAAQCLGKIKDERAIAPLFEAMGQENFFTDEAIISALCSFGESSKKFLFKVLRTKPFSKDNEHAAIALNSFGEDADVATCCLSVLSDPETFKHHALSTYLIFACSNLADPIERQNFITLSKSAHLAPALKDEMNLVIRSWKSQT